MLFPSIINCCLTHSICLNILARHCFFSQAIRVYLALDIIQAADT